MKKYVIAGVLVVAFVAYIVFANRNPSPPALTDGTTSTPSSTPSAAGAAAEPATTSTSGSGTGGGQYKDGTYMGSVADAFYGNLQAEVTIQGGMITAVTFPQHPSGGNSSNVSAFALPALEQEAIAAQSANVDIVSGATQDSQAFQQSLAVALAQAKN